MLYNYKISIENNVLMVKSKNKIFKRVGIFIMCLILFIVVFIYFFYPMNFVKKKDPLFDCFIISILFLYVSKQFYIFIIDNDLSIVKIDSQVIVNRKCILLNEINCILYVEFSGYRSMAGGCNLYLVLNNKSKIPIIIKSDLEDGKLLSEKILNFLSLNNFQYKKANFIEEIIRY